MINRKIDFTSTFFEEGMVPSSYSSVCYRHNSEPILVKKNEDIINNKTTSIRLIPRYLKLKLNENERSFKIKQYVGYAIICEQFKSFNDYLTSHFSAKFKSTHRKNVERLEQCFDVNYKMFYGNISFEEYNYLMNCLNKMIVRRFKQRNDKHKTLKYWEHYMELFYKLIVKKQASLFVIYDDKTPISISFSYKADKILFGYITSYNIDYGKFSIGNISIYKKLEWCFENGIKIYDFGLGYVDYKKKWSHYEYKFDRHIVYGVNDLRQKTIAQISINKEKLKECIKSLSVTSNLKNQLSKFSKRKHVDKKKNVLLEDVNNYSFKENQLQKINYNIEEYAFLKKQVFDFLYFNREYKENVVVYKILSNKKEYLISGSALQQKIRFQN